MNESWEDFKGRFSAWGSRPPATPAETAGRRIAARLGPSPRRHVWWQFAAAAVLLVGLVLTLRYVSAPHRTPVPADLPTGFQPATEDTVIWIVDPHTTVIFTLQPGRSMKGTES